jgi:hypothetical protein
MSPLLNQKKKSANLPKWIRYYFRKGSFILGNSEIKAYRRQIELFAIQDRFSRFILHACIKESPSERFTNYLNWFDTRPCFLETFKRFGYPTELIADPFLVKNPKKNRYLKENILFVTPAEHPASVASLDSFFGRLQFELRADLTERNIRRYVNFWNYQRPHSALEGFSPACALICGSEKRFEVFKKNARTEDKKALFQEIKSLVLANFA